MFVHRFFVRVQTVLSKSVFISPVLVLLSFPEGKDGQVNVTNTHTHTHRRRKQPGFFVPQ